MINPLRIGPLSLDTNLLLAPIAVFWLLLFRFGSAQDREAVGWLLVTMLVVLSLTVTAFLGG